MYSEKEKKLPFPHKTFYAKAHNERYHNILIIFHTITHVCEHHLRVNNILTMHWMFLFTCQYLYMYLYHVISPKVNVTT